MLTALARFLHYVLAFDTFRQLWFQNGKGCGAVDVERLLRSSIEAEKAKAAQAAQDAKDAKAAKAKAAKDKAMAAAAMKAEIKMHRKFIDERFRELDTAKLQAFGVATVNDLVDLQSRSQRDYESVLGSLKLVHRKKLQHVVDLIERYAAIPVDVAAAIKLPLKGWAAAMLLPASFVHHLDDLGVEEVADLQMVTNSEIFTPAFEKMLKVVDRTKCTAAVEATRSALKRIGRDRADL